MLRTATDPRRAPVSPFAARAAGPLSGGGFAANARHGVITFAVTLLVVSPEVPRTFDGLLQTTRGFLAFAATSAVLFHVWFVRYRFFRRYGLGDNFLHGRLRGKRRPPVHERAAEEITVTG